jgi:hypothetical protein
MPFTPFHFGPGYLLAAPRKTAGWFSFYVFALTQVLIDCETLWNMLHGNERLHTFFHTFAGSIPAAALSALAAWILFPPLHFMLGGLDFLRKLRLWHQDRPTIRAITASALVGSVSHVCFDAINHHDVRPFWPASGANPFYDLVPSSQLYLGFWLLGMAAFAWILLRDFRGQD